MSNEAWIGKKGFRYWYYKFRDSELYSFTTVLITMVICLGLVIYWIIPELNNWFSIRDEVVSTKQHISTLQQNIDFMNSLNKDALNQQLQVATNTLPADKDFGAILDSISNASANSGVALNDYSFQVGDIASSSALPAKDATGNGFSSVQVVVIVNGTFGQLRNFIKSLENSFPLSQVNIVDGGQGSLSISILFYQKPFPYDTFSAETPIAPLSEDQNELLQKLSQWNTATGTRNASQQTGSGSAIPLF
ncbi:MAG TPA: hypothetical protein VLF93_02040 [Candidatus Saccharimonadales bacterium]|nr:hypothetical protein [Candidatus Saccharimonadales bacterium]